MPKVPLVAMVLALLPVAAVADGGWEAQLSEEVRIAEDCDVAFLGQVVEREVDGRKLVMAKVTCVDKRSFDAYREDEFEPFSFKECAETADATTC